MGVSSTQNRKLYAGDGSSTTFSFPYYFFNQADLQVWLYDTVAGGTVEQVLNTNYSVTGTQNFQGLYQNGGSIVFNSAPPNTAVVVIFRNGEEVNNYSLLQNGNISSAAIVQQFDYLTLLIQRLEDQAAQAISVPDGLGEVFSNQLPSNVSLMAGMSLMVNANGNGWVLGGGPFVWQNVVIPYTAFQDAAFTFAVPAFTLLPGYILVGTIVKHATAFSGTSITGLTIDVGISGAVDQFNKDFNAFQSVGDQAFDFNMPNYLASFANSTVVQAQATSTGAELSALAAGSVTIWYLMQNLNPVA